MNYRLIFLRHMFVAVPPTYVVNTVLAIASPQTHAHDTPLVQRMLIALDIG
jgi:hypothetical protein